MSFGTYLTSDNVRINLVDNFIAAVSDFDAAHKWRYFMAYANSIYGGTINKPNINIGAIKYMQGVGIGQIQEDGDTEVKIKGAKTSGTDNPAFKTNCANQYEAQTEYYGYYPSDVSKRISDLFGASGWINITDNIKSNGIWLEKDPLVTTTLSTTDLADYNVIICAGDIIINASADPLSPTEFYGMIVSGGSITVNGNLKINESKSDIIDMILYGADNENSAAGDYSDKNKLFNIFKYDNSGTTYIITKTGEDFINISDLIGITNWKKQDRGFF
jgi:hypothetical protein